ncbi:retrotransposon protein, putative, ty1-copia subclass [Tanacetum coccineum]|uniref:Retrotransposon protein, putative, ty1-copia subclass n=1 Tax=Tanacetum coccineum TaxID=301880 RepID=A0ABQ5EM57_9ASTR
MNRSLFTRIVRDLSANCPYFQEGCDAVGKAGISALVKCTSAIRQLAYAAVPDSLDEYLQIGEKTSRDCLMHFCNGVIELYGEEYLRRPTQTDVEKLYAFHENKHGFPGSRTPMLPFAVISDLGLCDRFGTRCQVDRGTGIIYLNSCSRVAGILFDSGAEKSFVSSAFTHFIDIAPTALNTSYEVELADGKVEVLMFIIGMDWLAYHRALIDCYEKIVRIPLPNGKILEVQGERPKKDLGSLACIKADEKKLDDIVLSGDYLMVFQDELLVLPLRASDRFRIDLNSRRSPVVFKNEVENQLEKTIRALRSDRGGEYISQEFKDYLKACGIVQQLTPPYTPQHNGVSERRNRTLLDMVRSMMNLTTLPLSFWDYALEFAARILNMVPTKKVDKKSYELWFGKVPNLAYLKVWGCEALVKRDMPDKLQQRSVKVYAKFFEKSLITKLLLQGIAAFYDYEIWQIDVKTAFLNGYLDEDIYMVQPEGFVDPKHLRNCGFAQNLDETCVYQKASGSNVTFFILYVDDIIIMGNHIPSLQIVKDYLGKCFAMKDLGEATFILGIKIYRDRSKRLIGLGQNAYMDTILKRYKMYKSKRGHIPMQERLDLNKTQGASTLKRCFQQNPGELYWTAVKNILKYLRNNKDMFLVYDGNPEAKLRVDCYCDAGFEIDRDDIKSQTGYVFILNGCAVDWKSSKQSTTAMSATEAEYIVASEAAMEVVWIRKFISGLGIIPTINKPIKMFCDNFVARLIANEPGVQNGARHDHRRYHYVREYIELGEINLLKVHTYGNLVDSFTKSLPKGKLTQYARSIGLRLATSFM